MENTIYLDIETIPAQSPEARQRISDAIKPPGTHKKPETIAAWMAENHASAFAAELDKTSFDPALGHVCTIAWAIDDQPVKARHAASVNQERLVIEAFFADIRPFHRTRFVGHNVGAFDLRFLLCRSVVLGIRIPRAIPRDPKPWDSTIFDTMTAWAGAKGRISMDNLCQALNLPGKDGFDGSMVAEAYANGEHDKIVAYCADDVEKIRAVYRRFEAADW